MKIISCLLALIVAANAAVPTVVVDANLNCLVNGSDWGKAGDVIVNNKDNAELVVAVNVALMAHLNKVKSDSDAANVAAAASVASSVATEKARADAAIATANAAKTAAEQSQAAAVAARQAAETAKTTAEAKRDAIIASLKGVAPTLLPANVRAELLDAREKERAALLARKAAIDAEVAAIP